ncbi:hypothetical protein SRIMM317S_04763 [Streptomyces rimosus subsp. rimosus]
MSKGASGCVSGCGEDGSGGPPSPVHHTARGLPPCASVLCNVTAKAGAVGLVLYDHSGAAPVKGNLETPQKAHIPAVGITKAEGEKLAQQVAGAR